MLGGSTAPHRRQDRFGSIEEAAARRNPAAIVTIFTGREATQGN
jgi:hypothetical protein